MQALGLSRVTAVLFAVLMMLSAPTFAQVPAGLDFRVNIYTPGGQYLPRIAVAPDGSFVVAWFSMGVDGSAFGAVARRFDAAGAHLGPEFVLSSYTTGNQGFPVPAMTKSGAFVVTWQDDRAIEVRHYDKSGNPIGAEFQVSTYTTGTQYRPDIANADNGTFVVTWSSQGPDGGGYGIAARAFSGGYLPAGPEFVVNTYTTGSQLYPNVASEPSSGDFVVVWEDRAPGRDGSGAGIFGQRFTAAGNRIGGEFQVNTFTTGDQRKPSVEVCRGGAFVVAWRSVGVDGTPPLEGMSARRFDASGAPVGPEFLVNTYTTGSQYSLFDAVTCDDQGNFVVAYHGGTGTTLSAQRFDVAGNRRGAEFTVNSNTTGSRFAPVVRSDAVGNLVVTWEDNAGTDGNLAGIFARRFGGLFPSSLRLDTPGNGVLEPGETVDLRPSWRNLNGAAQSFTGTLGGITGPPGATYAITDPAGDYGTLANGATAACTDCYGVSVSNPAVRPVHHWDVTAVESILPDTQGQQKKWVLHVGGSFKDVLPASPYYPFVETLFHRGITSGCSRSTIDTYCPLDATTREQMAPLLLVAKEGTGYAPPPCSATPIFADVPVSSLFCPWVEELARRGVVTGCTSQLYCPTKAVSREQMAVFALRTLDPSLNPPPCVPPNTYNDVPETSPYCPWIEELATRGAAVGCGGGNYCPTETVPREQMAVFISVTFGLSLYGP